jgi:hypothetical protein
MRALPVCVALLCGCASATTMETARVLDQGVQQYVIGPELNGGGIDDSDAKIGVPEVSFGIRRGLGHKLEVDTKLMVLPLGEVITSLGAEAALKAQIYEGDRFEIAVLAGGGYRYLSSSGARWEAVYANVPVLLGINVRDHDQIVIGPRIGISRWYSSGSRAVSMPQIGSSLGYAWAVRPSLTILPEVSWLYSPVPFQGREAGTALVTASIGFLFGH